MVSILANRVWYDLRSTAHAHGLTFHTRQSKTQVYQRLYRSLVIEGVLRRRFKQLSEAECDALRALQVAGGSLPLYLFQKTYGKIRFYRPWREDGTPQYPWKRPQSTTEKLWYLGFIELVKGKPNQVVLPDEVTALLPPLPPIEPAEKPPLRVGGKDSGVESAEIVCIDLAVLVGTLLHHDVHPLHGRWLPPSMFRSVNACLHMPENLDGIRSELKTSRLRFLHYLAEAAGLVAVQAGILKPTVQAWRWLDLPPDERWQALRDAMNADLKGRIRLWDRYRFPSVDTQTWTILADHLQRLTPGYAYKRKAFIDRLRLYLPTVDDINAHISPLLDGPLTWLGMVSMEGDTFRTIPRLFSEPQNAELVQGRDILCITLPSSPRLHPLVTCLAWTVVKAHRLHIDAAVVRRAVETGSDVLQMGSVLSQLIGEPLPPVVFEQIQTWGQAAQALTLRQVTMLTAGNADVLRQIHADWRLRPLLGKPLSPHHATVPSGRAEELLAKLERRGYHVTSQPQQSTTPDDSPLSPEMVEYLWLAVRVYQKLGAFVSQNITIPGAVRTWLTQQLPAGSADSLEAEGNILIDRLAQSIRGHSPSPAVIRQTDLPAIRSAVQSAYEQRESLTIEYFSPARGEKTIRTIEPVMLYERNGAEYVEAWCRLDDDTRTFRIDRILKVIADGNHAG